MSFMKSWVLKDSLPLEVSEDLNVYPEILRELLYNRGIDNATDAHIFLKPDYNRDLNDPFLILNMERAVERIIEAIKLDEKIIIFADYDADGIPGSVVLHDFFKEVGFSNFEVYIPHRYKEGYGLNIGAIEDFGRERVNLIITIDTGITNFKEVERANRLGIDVIITDHHLPAEDMPPSNSSSG